MVQKQLLVIGIVMFYIIVGFSGCIQQKQQTNEDINTSDKYIFITHQIDTSGELLEGTYIGPLIDRPTYSFNETTGNLTGWIDFEINNSLKIIYGAGSSLSGVAGGGASSKLYGVYELPYEYNGFKILTVNTNGTVSIEYLNLTIVLQSGEQWRNITSRIDEKPDGKANLTIKDTIVNYGIQEKLKVTLR